VDEARSPSRHAKDNAANRDALLRLAEFAGGINYYFAQHPFKLQADYTRLAQNGDYAGALGRLRVQLQAGF
jgi:hypothetical protein